MSSSPGKRPAEELDPNPAEHKKPRNGRGFLAPASDLPDENNSRGGMKSSTRAQIEERNADLERFLEIVAAKWGKNPYNHATLTISSALGDVKRVVYVSNLILAKASPFFEQLINTSKNPDSLDMKLPPGFSVDTMEQVIKCLYSRKLEVATTMEVLDVCKLALRFQVMYVALACQTQLGSLNVSQAQELLKAASVNHFEESMQEVLEPIIAGARDVVCKDFMNLENVGDDFLNLTPYVLFHVLDNPKLVVGTENTVFAAMRQWIHHDFEKRKKHLSQMLDAIRFPYLTKDYLLDVVKSETKNNYSIEDSLKLGRCAIEAFRYNLSNENRRTLLNEPRPKDRIFSGKYLVVVHDWTIPDFASVTSLTSDPIFFNGYYFNLQFLRTAPKDEKSGVGVYLRLDLAKTGVEEVFYIPMVFDFQTRNKKGNYTSNRGVYFYPFTRDFPGLGYTDAFGTTWDAVADPSFPYNCDGDLHFRIKLTFYSKSESRAGYSPQRDSADDDMSKEKKTNIVKRRSKLH